MDISCAFATSSDTPAHVELAETLGYRNAWLYDSPALYPDVWIVLSRCAERTTRIGLGPGAGPAAVVLYHAVYERGGAAVDAFPGGEGWRKAVEEYPEDERHLAIHAGHLVQANPRDEPHVADLIPLASSMALTGTAEQVAEKIAGLAGQGVTEIVYQPAGSGIERELEAFAAAAGLAG
jgi:alkanesulfonate monooxygenase SsuD/methylene tetrahydromethanopterin reductase-like flavin-dependent oxidoreductase (luciferase family)